MPELPEVETTLRGLRPHLQDRRIDAIHVREPRLRWPVPEQVRSMRGARIQSLDRRAKYLLIGTDRGHLIWHLGMSGSLRVQPAAAPAALHEHIQVDLDDGASLRYRDPRRFGSLLFTDDEPQRHPLIAKLGPEPLADAFNAEYLRRHCRGRSSAIKTLIMNSHIVVGIGNIYACEALFLSRINPKTAGGRISPQRLERLVAAIKSVLTQAIAEGGTTLQDFTRADGKPGYFRQHLQVYGHEGPCPACGRPIRRITLGQRSTFYCSHCQR